VITADAMHAQRAHAEYLTGQRGAHFVLTVKRNQPGLHAQLAGPPWRQIPPADIQRERGHGRAERRTLKITTVAAGLAFPARSASPPDHAPETAAEREEQQEMVHRDGLRGDLTDRDPGTPRQLAGIIRGHWSIEDRLHWIRDVTYDEVRSQIHARNGPRVMASLRNLAITILRLTGETIAAALRHHAPRPCRPLQTIMQC
jgi:predicted transposase YbfD/YdcC